ncbi:YciI family protein [Ponticoccus sp. SC2-23]|uniref:YciI family protein n=1 Tax=Alexandriicola marinus TaxID=2081710 RepID=UPI000FDAE32B|nr:YciI family protein [Alexandriicola marinus]MBM1219259.1 YciI family protein [Ponticoccus sp. SC6-9]MBM1223669.1 YciI family protein [Ponticoccus sp. SC6-15]MBM1229072.1 YciI family protein [Ponticoccus sp. SC6-38]MBM1232635.1 YciI family protein [Ponticoccus sp. SC6-45]MBM1237415.1 YciI family protein [Ponticoccus sp. SC6-49]MBM1241646.1 YciI family protein [Ponticoccus sp. SC2-64]MBM1246159.1 YciI family protein [Ponticoccus sp. SC6-42]MBM1250637.1 YciI family protein [Ponticoccus sp. 
MQYMCLIYSPPPPADQPDPEPGTPEFEAYMKPWNDFSEKLVADSVMVGGEALMPVEMATSVRVRGGKTETMDGPFAETKEQLGGYYIIDCKTLDDAIRYAAMIPVADFGTIEVRPVMDLSAAQG